MEWILDDLDSTTLVDHDVPTLLTHVSEGLLFMYANGFTYQDLKPESILVKLSKRRLTTAKIADFGTDLCWVERLHGPRVLGAGVNLHQRRRHVVLCNHRDPMPHWLGIEFRHLGPDIPADKGSSPEVDEHSPPTARNSCASEI